MVLLSTRYHYDNVTAIGCPAAADGGGWGGWVVMGLMWAVGLRGGWLWRRAAANVVVRIGW